MPFPQARGLPATVPTRAPRPCSPCCYLGNRRLPSCLPTTCSWKHRKGRLILPQNFPCFKEKEKKTEEGQRLCPPWTCLPWKPLSGGTCLGSRRSGRSGNGRTSTATAVFLAVCVAAGLPAHPSEGSGPRRFTLTPQEEALVLGHPSTQEEGIGHRGERQIKQASFEKTR